MRSLSTGISLLRFTTARAATHHEAQAIVAAIAAFAGDANRDRGTGGADAAIERRLGEVVRHVGYVSHHAALSVSWASASTARSGGTDVLRGRNEAVGEEGWRAIGQGRPQAVSQMRAQFGTSEVKSDHAPQPAIVTRQATPAQCMNRFHVIDDLRG